MKFSIRVCLGPPAGGPELLAEELSSAMRSSQREMGRERETNPEPPAEDLRTGLWATELLG
jgi:hypothetical protein